VGTLNWSEPVDGTWTGHVEQVTGGSYPLKIVADHLDVAIEYPTLGCTGTLVLGDPYGFRLMGEGARNHFTETIDSGPCLDGYASLDTAPELGRFVPGELRYDFLDEDGDSVAVGTLLRTGTASPSCTIADNLDGTHTITCGTQMVTVSDGQFQVRYTTIAAELLGLPRWGGVSRSLCDSDEGLISLTCGIHTLYAGEHEDYALIATYISGTSGHCAYAYHGDAPMPPPVESYGIAMMVQLYGVCAPADAM